MVIPSPASGPPQLRPASKTSCSGCALYCDDVVFEIGATGTPQLATPCDRGRQWVAAQQRQIRAAQIQGQSVSNDLALGHGLSMLRRSLHPQLVGLPHLSLANQRLAIEWIQRWRGSADLDAQQIHSDSQLALSLVGRVTSTLGQIADAADLVIVWGNADTTKYPRLPQRLLSATKNWWQLDLTEREASDLIQWWRIIAKQWKQAGIPNWQDLPAQKVLETGTRWGGQAPIEWLKKLHQIVSSRYVAWLDARNPSHMSSAGAHSFYSWVRELNDWTRSVSLPLSANFNSSGAENVLAWTTGFSRSVNFNGEPRSGESFSARRQIESGDIDLLIAVVGESQEDVWPPSGQPKGLSIPVILLHACDHPAASRVELAIPIPHLGWDIGGEVCRLDDWVIDRPAFQESDFIRPEQVFSALTCSEDRAAPSKGT